MSFVKYSKQDASFDINLGNGTFKQITLSKGDNIETATK